MSDGARPSSVVQGCGCLFYFGALALFGFGLFDWLKFGDWPSLTTGEVVGCVKPYCPTTSWVGLNRVIEWVMGIQAVWTAFLIGSVAVWYSDLMETDELEAKRRAAQAERDRTR